MTNRVVIGQFPDGGYGMRISKPGYDVLSNPIKREKLMFDSNWDNTMNFDQTGVFYMYGDGKTTNTSSVFNGYVYYTSEYIPSVIVNHYTTYNTTYVAGLHSCLHGRVDAFMSIFIYPTYIHFRRMANHLFDRNYPTWWHYAIYYDGSKW